MESIRIGRKRYYTIKQTAFLSGMPVTALYKRVERKSIDALKMGRYLFIEVNAVKALTIEKLKEDLRR